MSYYGDIPLGNTIDIKFTTRSFSTGIPTTAASLAVVAYPGNSTTELTAGITTTFTSGFDALAGLVNVRVVATSGNGYATATDYILVVSAGTVGGVSIVGEVVGEFSIENRSALRPTTINRTLDVTATGEAGIDWANVGAPTTALALTGTTIATTQKVDVETIKTNAVVNAGTITFPTTATLASTTNITAGTMTTTTNLTTNNDKTGYALSATGSAALTEGYAADGAAPTLNQILYMIWAMLAEKSVVTTTLTAKKLDGSTSAMTFTLDSAVTPTSITRAT